ncbi:MAG: tRNA (adenosine(37)-N6)-threonylcarbamoyltransferase complex ATPase subunit type 1 TsaE [Brumimicrobium sp.]|nr:tRNA (adenosine(37)-N6)-threonylcarbamoyltransferase complex ATPase subunit type 1 TsaE [Brumimicrobium sp.]
MKFLARSEKDLITIATEFLKLYDGHRIFAFRGEMGSGKTTFISYLARAMGITDEVSSPTYGYLNEYESPVYGMVYHFDLYRIASDEEAYDIGLEEYLYGEDYVFLEWAENIHNLLPDNCVWVSITKDEHDTRTIEVTL